MRNAAMVPLVLLASTFFASCLASDHDPCGEGFTLADNNCIADESEPGPDQQAPDAGDDIDPEQWLGSSCTCTSTPDSPCVINDIPMPNQGEIAGCDSVPADWPGAVLACRRSYAGGANRPSYFANGFCTLLAVGCTGTPIVCDIATIGDYAAMLSCPEGSALVITKVELDTAGLRSTISYKICAPICESNDDCRSNENDPVFDDKTQYQCLERDGVRFCMDPRNLSSDDTAEAF